MHTCIRAHIHTYISVGTGMDTDEVIDQPPETIGMYHCLIYHVITDIDHVTTSLSYRMC